MAFIVKKVTNYFWPVKYDEPSNGTFDTQTFDAEFKRLSASRYKKLLNAKDTNDELFCTEVLIGWKGIQDESGAEIPYSETKKAEFIDRSGFARAVSVAYIESVNGQKIKN